MNEESFEIIEVLKGKITDLKNLYLKTISEKERLLQEKIELSRRNEEQLIQIADLEKKYKSLQFAQAVTGTAESNVAARERLMVW
ncbi:MAG: hypothetical protein IPO21_20430 [Bacteroidales bacterium]|nr:hypothetical protein [Bacteroidales bacterium]